MLYANLGRTGLIVSRLCLGTMMFGSQGNADVHDSVNEEAGLLLAEFLSETIAPVAPPRPSHSSFPPLKPPRLS